MRVHGTQGACPGVLVVDSAHTIVAANQSLHTLLGWRSSIVGQSLSVCLPPELGSYHARVVAEFFARGAVFRDEPTRIVMGVKQDGKRIKLRVSLTHLSHDRVAASVTPVLDRAMVVFIDAAGRILRVSGAAHEMTGHLPDALIGANVALFCRPLLDKIRFGSPATEVRHANGAAHVVNVFVKNVQENIFKCSIKEIDFDVLATLLVSPDGSISAASSTCLNVFGYSASELEGKPIGDVLPRFLSTSPEGSRYVIARAKDTSLYFVHVTWSTYSPTQRLLSVHRTRRKGGKIKAGAHSHGLRGSALGWYQLKPDARLGEGSCGEVELARHRLTKVKVAMKIVSRRHYEEMGLPFPPREIDLMAKLSHPNICYLYHTIRHAKFVYMALELCDGDLFEYAIQHGALDPTELVDFTRQIVAGIDYMHSMGVCHRDLKLENILLRKGRVKIIDVGLGNFFDRSGSALLQTFAGSPDYAAPELWEREEYYGPAVDVFAIGVIVYVLSTNLLPFNTPASCCELRYRWPDPKKYRVTASDDCKDLIGKIFRRRVDRIDIQDIINHPFLAKNAPPFERIVNHRTLDALNPDVVQEMTLLGFYEHEIKAAIQADERNQITTTYWMLQEKMASRFSAAQMDDLDDSSSSSTWTDDETEASESSFISEA